MKKQSLPIKIKQLKKMCENRTLTFDNPIQRRSDQWSLQKKGLLVNSILADYIIPPLYFVKEDKGSIDTKGRKICNYDVIDGKQRLLNLFAYINGEYKLHEATPAIEVDGEEVEIAGKFFNELDEDLQDDILNFNFTIYNLEGNSDEDIEEFFLRINGGENLSKNQNTKGIVGITMMKYLNPFLSGNFFSNVCNFSGAQYKSEVDFCTMLQCLMMLDVEAGNYEFVSLSENDTQKYGGSIHDGLDNKTKEDFEKIMSYLEETFPEEKKEKWLRKTHIPMVFLMAKKAMEKGILPNDFNAWFNEFAYTYYNPECDYAEFCGAGSVKKQKVYGRIETMQKHFDAYFAENAEKTDDVTCEDSSNSEESESENSGSEESTKMNESSEETEENQ